MIRVPADTLQPGDVTRGTGETVIRVSAGVRTPSGKVDVVLEKNGRQRTATWRSRTVIAVNREAP